MSRLIKKERIGEKFINHQGLTMELIEYFNYHNCTVKFEDGVVLKDKEYYDLKRGLVNNPNFPTFCNIGYIGVGKYIPIISKKLSKSYRYWINMINRCYSKNSTYEDCSVVEEWHNYQNFAKWFEENYNPEIMTNWSIDKDILVKGNRIYGPDTCCFVPYKINTLFVKQVKNRGEYPIGVSKFKNKYVAHLCKNSRKLCLGYYDTPLEAFDVYKKCKERLIKETAESFIHKLSDNVYKTMINYVVEITD